MATTPKPGVDVETINWQRALDLVNNQGYKLLDLESKYRGLEMRLDGLVPTTINTTVFNNNKALMIGIAVVSVSVGVTVGRNWKRWQAEAKEQASKLVE